MKRRGVRESDPFDWEKAGSDSTQSEGLGTAVKSSAPQTNKVIITDNVEQQATVDNQENVEPDNRKDPARFANLANLYGHIDDGLDDHLDDNLDLEQDDRP